MKIELTEEQLNIVEAVRQGHNVYVDACIGSGKTTLLDALAKRNFRKRILYLTYNKLLKEDAKKKINLSNVEIHNYHGFAYRYLSYSGYRYTHQNGIKDLLILMNSNKISVPQYDMILVDEYQDITDDAKDLIMTIDKFQKVKPQLVFVGDMKQKIYETSTVNVVEECIFKLRDDYKYMDLTQCFRLNESHAQMISNIWGKDIKGVNEEQVVRMQSHDLDTLCNILNGYNNKDILILTPFRNNVMVSELINHIEKVNPVKYNKTNLYVTVQDGRDDTNKPVKNSMIVTTFDGAKGLERALTIVYGFTGSSLYSRTSKGNADIITNLFLVAASRGKKEIIFINKSTEEPLTDKNFNLYISDRLKETRFSVSKMFDFKFESEVRKCYDLLDIKRISTEDTSEIKYVDRDYNLLLSPSMGIYQEAMFFKKWDFNVAMSMFNEEEPVVKYIRKSRPKGLMKQVLAITAAETGLIRYINQTVDEFIEPEYESKLKDRLRRVLSDELPIQIVTGVHEAGYDIKGIVDVIKDNVPYELKFVGTLEYKHYLQIAMYVYMMEKDHGFLWNTRFNQLYRVSIKDRRAFINQVLKTITKGDYYGK